MLMYRGNVWRSRIATGLYTLTPERPFIDHPGVKPGVDINSLFMESLYKHLALILPITGPKNVAIKAYFEMWSI